MPQPKDDPIPQVARATLELFGTQLREVRFPDLDHGVLTGAADELQEAQLEVECIETALEQARAVVRDKAAQLSALADRGLSYARVFAAGNVQLSAKVGEIERMGRTHALGAAEAPKKRGRPRKGAQETGLFNEEADVREEEAAE